MENLEFVAKYWSQISVLKFGIGYCLKTTFEYRLKEKEIKFNFIHSKRADIIKELYSKFSELSREVESISLGHYLSKINQGPNRTENKSIFWKIVELNKSIKILMEDNRIYFTDDFTYKIESFCKTVDDNIIVPSVNVNDDIDANSLTLYNDTEKFSSFYKNQFPAIKKNIICEFQRYL